MTISCLEEVDPKERNKIRAQLTRKRKKDYYTDLEGRYKLLESENLRLKQTIEDLKQSKYNASFGWTGNSTTPSFETFEFGEFSNSDDIHTSKRVIDDYLIK